MTYIAAPAVPESPIFSTTSGNEFRFYFVNGSILEGSTNGGPVLLDGVDITGEVVLSKNSILFDPEGDDPAFLMHLSCSDQFIGGWGESDGPTEGVDVNWQIASYSISRYNKNGFIRSCAGTPADFNVSNMATATATDSFGAETVIGHDSVEIVAP